MTTLDEVISEIRRRPFFIFSQYPDRRLRLYEIVEEVFNIFENIGEVKIPRSYVGSFWKEGEYGSAEWYIRQAYDPERRQVISRKLWDLFQREPWQRIKPHYELMIIQDFDLTVSSNVNFVFGDTRPLINWEGKIVYDVSRGVIVSIYRMRKWYRDEWDKAFKTILLHELGHFYGVPNKTSPNFIGYGRSEMAKSYLDYLHCNDRRCVMEQVNVPGRMDLLVKAKYLERYNPKYFCDYCLRTLRQNLQMLYG